MDTDKTESNVIYLAPQPSVSVLGVNYLHLLLEDGSDLYLTQYGMPFARNLLPDNHWCDQSWFAEHSVKLSGTSTLYKIRTKQIDGICKDIVLKWNRMGQDIPGATEASELLTAEFNSPFEEFSLVIELRKAHLETPGQLYTHKPLAIYVPKKFVEAERIGRKPYILAGVQSRHDEIHLDLNRQYAVMYEWIKGIDAEEAFRKKLIDERVLESLVLRTGQEMNAKGYVVRDNKSRHIIVRSTKQEGLMKDRKGKILYAMIDFELLERTPQREQDIRTSKRKAYLVKQVRRFETKEGFPPGLEPVTIMGVDYVYGRVESTDGRLWVVGNDPSLFEYFLPEKWRKTPRTKLSSLNETYHTVTKDNIHLVWRVSRIGKKPEIHPDVENERCILEHGYNSPFEETSLSMELVEKGVKTTYPRAIYMSSRKADISPNLVDNSRHLSHKAIMTSDGHPILGKHHEHIIIWGYWNGPDELLAIRDVGVYKGIDAISAYKEGRITKKEYWRVIQTSKERLAKIKLEDLNLKGNHLLLSIDQKGRVVTDRQGIPSIRICNFELLRRIE